MELMHSDRSNGHEWLNFKPGTQLTADGTRNHH